MRDFDQYGNKITMSANHIIGSGRTITPTAKLRFTDRDGVRVLQQWWMEIYNLKGSIGEWRDIPIENESEPYKDSDIEKGEWVGLTDEEVDDAAHYCVKSGQSVNAAMRTIEARLKEKNT